MKVADAVRYFSSREMCESLMRALRWPHGRVECTACGSRNVGEIATRRLLRCRGCRRQIYAKQGTLFQDSPLGLEKWFTAIWCVANCAHGISSRELAGALGVQQKTAWFMLRRIRAALDAARNGTARRRQGAVYARVLPRVTGARREAVQACVALCERLVRVPKAEVDARCAKASRAPQGRHPPRGGLAP